MVENVRAAVAALVFVVVCMVAAYVGVMELFVGGIVQFIDGIKADPTNGEDVAWGIAKVFVLAEVVAGLIVMAGAGVAYLIWPKFRLRRGR
jgi:hypothetical protein